ncbi:PD-(D/E)XK motif protein [Mesoplasma melaleucae]
MELTEMRGLFAELECCIKYNLIPSKNNNSIFDFIFESNDIEIKSYSKVKRDVILSYQQLTNNSKAKLFLVEVIESSEGKTIFELFKKINTKYKNKFKDIYKYSESAQETKFLATKINIVEMKKFLKA